MSAGNLSVLMTRLSPRQRELVQLLGEGRTLREAADLMGISRKTANAHKCRLMFHIGAESRNDVVEASKFLNIESPQSPD